MKNKIKIILIMLVIVLLDQIVKNNMIGNIAQTEEAYALGVDSIILLIIVNVFIIYALARILIKNYKNLTEAFKLGIALVLSGEISNLVDRIFRGYIVRYIDIAKYGTINISDICITIGIIVMIINFLILMVKNQEELIKK